MATPTLDFRPKRFWMRWPPAGATTVTLRAPAGTLEGRELRMWVQPKALPVPDVEQATATATISAVTADEVDGDEFDVAVATFADVALLTQSTWYRVLIADGDDVWCNGLVKTSNDGTGEQSTTLTVTVASGSIELSITVAPAGPGGGTALPAGIAGQMFRLGEDGETFEAVSPNAPGAWLRLNGTGHVPDVHLAADIVRESEMDTAIAAAIDDLIDGAPGALDTLTELAAALGDDEAFAATVTSALAAKVTQAQVDATIAAGAVVLVDLHLPIPLEWVPDSSFVSADEGFLSTITGEPAGLRLLFSAQTVATNSDVWVHQGDGVLVRTSPSALGATRIGTWVVSRDNPIGSSGPEAFLVTAANELEQLTVTEAQVQALIDASLGTAIVDAVDTAVDAAIEAIVAPLQHFDEDLAAALSLDEPTAWFSHNGSTSGRLSTANPGAFTAPDPENDPPERRAGFMHLSWTRITGVPDGGNKFGETASSPLDGGTDGEDPDGGNHDGFEGARVLFDDTMFDTSGPVPVAIDPSLYGKWGTFWEHTADPDSTEEDVQVYTATNIFPNVWIAELQMVDATNGVYRLLRRVRDGHGDFVTTHNGWHWRLEREVTDERFEQIIQTKNWWTGNNFPGDTAISDVFDGWDEVDGEITPGAAMVNPRPEDWTSGPTLTDGAGNVHALNSATVVDTTATPAETGGIEVVESLGSQTAITNAGTWPGALHTAVALPSCAAGDLIDFDAVIEWINSAGAVRRPVITLTLGATTVTPPAAAVTLASGTTRQFVVSGRVHVLSPTSQRISFTGVCENFDTLVGVGSATEDMSTEKNLTVNAGSNSATGTQSAQLLSLHVRKITA